MQINSIKDFYENEEFDNLIHYLNNTPLEIIGNSVYLFKTLTKLEMKGKYKTISEIINIISKYKINILEKELKEGLRILSNAK